MFCLFVKKAHQNHTNRIPDNFNLKNSQIDECLDSINKTLIMTMQVCLPKRKSYVTSTRYVNKRIQVIHKSKSYLLSQLYKVQRSVM